MTNKFKLFIASGVVIITILSCGLLYKTGHIQKVLNKAGLTTVNARGSAQDNNGKAIVYFLKDNNVETLAEDLTNIPADIPDRLIVPKGHYRFSDQGSGYSLNREGLYRFVVPNRENIQKIVFESDIDALLSSISWIVTHGITDDKKTIEELTAKAKTSKLFISCGNISQWAQALLASQGIQSRIVGGITLDEWNDYDNGHRMLEIHREDLGKWVLYDLDNNAYFIDPASKKPLNLIEFSSRIANRDYQIIALSADTRVDISAFQAGNGYDYGFFAEAVNAEIETWYARIMQVPLINDESFYYFFDLEHKDRLERYASYYKYIDKAEFMKKYY